MREARGGQKPASFPFGMLGFAKPVLLEPWKGQRMVLCCYLGISTPPGGGNLHSMLTIHTDMGAHVVHVQRSVEKCSEHTRTHTPAQAGAAMGHQAHHEMSQRRFLGW